MEETLNIIFTKNHPLPDDVKAKVVSILYTLIASYIDVKGQILEAHWNSEGKTFISMHKLFDDTLTKIDEFIDPLGERIRAFGAPARAKLKFASDNTLLKEQTYITNDLDANLNVVLYCLITLRDYLYIVIPQVSKMDETTSNILQEHCRDIDHLIYLNQSCVCSCTD